MYSVRPGAQDNNLSTAVCKHGNLQFKPDGGGVGRSAYLFSPHPLLCLRADGATFNHQNVSDSEAPTQSVGIKFDSRSTCLTGLFEYTVYVMKTRVTGAPPVPQVYQSPHTHSIILTAGRCSMPARLYFTKGSPSASLHRYNITTCAISLRLVRG